MYQCLWLGYVLYQCILTSYIEWWKSKPTQYWNTAINCMFLSHDSLYRALQGWHSFLASNSSHHPLSQTHFQARLQNIEKQLLASLCLSIRPLVRMEQIWLPLDRFSRNLIFEYFSKTWQKTQVTLKSGKSNWHFTWRPMYICDNILLNS